MGVSPRLVWKTHQARGHADDGDSSTGLADHARSDRLDDVDCERPWMISQVSLGEIKAKKRRWPRRTEAVEQHLAPAAAKAGEDVKLLQHDDDRLLARRAQDSEQVGRQRRGCERRLARGTVQKMSRKTWKRAGEAETHLAVALAAVGLVRRVVLVLDAELAADLADCRLVVLLHEGREADDVWRLVPFCARRRRRLELRQRAVEDL